MSSRTALIAALVAAVSGSIIPKNNEECCFQISASGGVTGTLGQIYDGQNRVGGGYAPATYCLKNGGLFDKNGRGCILTPPTTQWQCDEGAAPTYGFSIGPNGSAQYNGSPEFWACPVNDNGEWNVYTQPVKDQKKCVQISLHTSSQCGAPPPPPPAPPAPPKHEQPPPQPPVQPPPQQYAPPPPPAPLATTPVYNKPTSSAVPPPPPPPPATTYHHEEYKPSTLSTSTTPCSTATSSSSAKYVAPSSSSSSQAYVPHTTSTAQYVAPSSSSSQAYVPHTTSTAQYVAPSSSSSQAYVPHTTSTAQYVAPSSSSSSQGYVPHTTHAQYESPSSSQEYAAPTTTGFACNPAHEYPEGVKCVSTNGSLALVTPTAKP